MPGKNYSCEPNPTTNGYFFPADYLCFMQSVPEKESPFAFKQEIITETVIMRLLENGVVHYTYRPNAEVTPEEHRANYDALVKITGAVKTPVLVDSHGFANVSPEAKKLVRELEKVVPISRRAFVAKSLAHRMLANLYIAFYKPLVPTRTFTNYEDAFRWLLAKTETGK